MAFSPQDVNQATPQESRLVIYVGDEASTIEKSLSPLGSAILFKAEPRVSAALMAAAQHRAHTVIIDLTTDDDARLLLIAALAAARQPPRIVVLARLGEIGRHLRYPGVHSVIAVPMLPEQLRAAVSDRRHKPRQEQVVPPPEFPVSFKAPEVAARQDSFPGWRLYFLTAGRFMTVVSNLYKNAAFLLLATLFTAFMFYGFLIAFFLLSSGWGAPVTLSKGHQYVEKAMSDLGELKNGLSLARQRLNEAELEGHKAGLARDDARVLVDFMKGTIDSEIVTRLKQIKGANKTAARLEEVMKLFSESGGADKARASLRDLYTKRLITKRNYDSQLLGSLEVSQRASALETELDGVKQNAEQLSASIELLESLRQQLELGKMNKVTSATADLILLTKEAVDARSSLDDAISQVASAEQRQKLLQDTVKLTQQRIADIETSPLGRADTGRVDVIFVPYGNEKQFKTGSALYTCKLTVFFCHHAGTVGAALPGESNAVHPFFGKPLRGFFVEAKLDDPDAASEEIIHANRPPFFF